MAKAAAMLVALALVVVVLATSVGGASAQQCDAGQLMVCAPAVIDGSTPTAACCSNLRVQEPCFCLYARDPANSGYINSGNARRTLTSCNIIVPNC